jgi:hypothetical protein
MADLFSTDVLIRVVESLIAPPSFLLDRFFPSIQTEESEEIHFDLIDKTRRLAPFVSPVVQGRIVESKGFTTKTFRPAYIKDKRVFDANRPFKRSAGEQIGGNLSAMQRMQRLLAYDLIDQVEMIDRRLEVMAAEALRTGAVTVTGDQYPTQNINFGRDAGLTITLGAGAKWSDTGINPLDNLQTWAQLVLKKSGAMATDVVMDIDSWKVFRSNAAVLQRIELFRGTSTLVQNAQVTEGAVFMGSVDGFNFYVYSGWYIDDAGSEVPILPSGTVLLGSSQIGGVRAFGSIRDEEAGLQAMPMYPKSWVEKDPSVRYLLMQSAPLVVPTRVNASMAATVL